MWNAPAADRTAVINTPVGGASRSTRRPDVVPGVSPFIKDGGLLFLNPAAFATPQPGTFGNLERNSVHGPNFQQMDLVVVEAHRDWAAVPTSSSARRSSTCSTTTNFAYDGMRRRCPTRCPGSGESVDAGEPGAARTAVHGRERRAPSVAPTSTVGRTVGLGTNRQVQFAVRVGF